MDKKHTKPLQREILLSFWKIHILHHADERPVVGQWMLKELRGHGYDVSPGTLYPILHRMNELGWLKCNVDPAAGPRSRKEYTLTATGREMLAILRDQIQELYQEVVRGEEKRESNKE
ncbi:MAG: PadR family transcriptional regulator [Desulfosalsimonadaceae bacterium]